MQISRSIGDIYLKKPEYNREPLYAKFRLREPFKRPILSSDPSITVQELEPHDQFLILASDGLWEHLSNQEAVDIVQNSPRSVRSLTIWYCFLTSVNLFIFLLHKWSLQLQINSNRIVFAGFRWWTLKVLNIVKMKCLIKHILFLCFSKKSYFMCYSSRLWCNFLFCFLVILEQIVLRNIFPVLNIPPILSLWLLVFTCLANSSEELK